mmetsp:Transcript_8171/g.15035  ORF Transcript_8171/g.15035 Transcript_8171/m.15035 type:complete len:83 (+) Transcript_8171:95-343(+)
METEDKFRGIFGRHGPAETNRIFVCPKAKDCMMKTRNANLQPPEEADKRRDLRNGGYGPSVAHNMMLSHGHLTKCCAGWPKR